MGALPVNFETKIKDPKAIAAGYPYSIKAADLMKNFVDAKLEVEEGASSDVLSLEEYTIFGDNGHKGRGIRLSASGTQGAMLYWDAGLSAWVLLAAPSPTGLYVLTHNGTVPSWAETSECT